jgi:hypothetical protein
LVVAVEEALTLLVVMLRHHLQVLLELVVQAKQRQSFLPP